MASHLEKLTDGQTDGHTDRHTDGQTDGADQYIPQLLEGYNKSVVLPPINKSVNNPNPYYLFRFELPLKKL